MSNGAPGGRLSPDERREQLIAVATKHFSKAGVAGASMSDIADDAGVTRALVYHYFPGREALYEAVLQAEADRLLAATDVNPAQSARANVESALQAYFAFYARSSGGVKELYNVGDVAAARPGPAHTGPARPAPIQPAPDGAGADAPAPDIRAIADGNHRIQVDRLLQATGTPDTPHWRLALGAWLSFVEFAARHANQADERASADVLALCITTLEAVLGHPLPTTNKENRT